MQFGKGKGDHKLTGFSMMATLSLNHVD